MVTHSNKKTQGESSSPKEKDKSHNDVVFLGTTTRRYMEDAIFNSDNPLHNRTIFSGSWINNNKKPVSDDDTVYMYYHKRKNYTVMTTVQNDFEGDEGSHVGLNGRITPKLLENIVNKK